MNPSTNNLQSNEIDLKKLFDILIKRKITIFTLTFLITSAAIVYVMTAKPVYSGTAILEVGQVANEQYINISKDASNASLNIDNIFTLKILVSKAIKVSATIPKKTNLLKLSTSSNEKTKIKNKLEQAVTYVLDRHKELAKLHTGKNVKIKMTQLIGEITVDDTAIKPKKKLIIIVSFIIGMMLSIFLAFFLESIQSLRNLEGEKNQ